jgi:hypothetical protein
MRTHNIKAVSRLGFYPVSVDIGLVFEKIVVLELLRRLNLIR